MSTCAEIPVVTTIETPSNSSMDLLTRHPAPAPAPEKQTIAYLEGVEEKGKTRRVSIVTAEQKVRNFARAYIIGQLERHGHYQLVKQLRSFQPPSDTAAKCLEMIANQLAEERREQLEEICFELQISKETLKETFDTIADEMFHDSVKWGRIVTFIAFAGALADYCADHGLGEEVENIIDWTEEFVHDHLMQWIMQSGGWEAFITHFQENKVSLCPSKLLVGVSMAMLAVTGGLMMLRRLFWLQTLVVIIIINYVDDEIAFWTSTFFFCLLLIFMYLFYYDT